MWKVEKFLGCCDLEKSLVVIHWIQVIGGIVGFIACIIGIIVSQVVECKDQDPIGDMSKKECDALMTIIMVVCVVLIIGEIISVILSYLFIRGVNKRNHRLMAPVMVLTAIGAIFACLGIFFSIFSLNFGQILSSLISGVIWVYWFLCIYTLYEKVRDEMFNNNPQYRKP